MDFFIIEKDLIEVRILEVMFWILIKIQEIDCRMEESKLIELI